MLEPICQSKIYI